jgi:hypothetical protein
VSAGELQHLVELEAMRGRGARAEAAALLAEMAAEEAAEYRQYLLETSGELAQEQEFAGWVLPVDPAVLTPAQREDLRARARRLAQRCPASLHAVQAEALAAAL